MASQHCWAPTIAKTRWQEHRRSAAVQALEQWWYATWVEAIVELVDQQKVVRSPGGEAFAEGIAHLCADQIVDEIGGEGEADAVALDAREVSERVGEVGLADSARAHEDDVGRG